MHFLPLIFPIRCCILIWASFTFILNLLRAICSLTLSWDTGQAHHFPFFGGSWGCLFVFARSDETRGKEINLQQCVSGGKTYILILSTIHFSYTNVISKQPLFRCHVFMECKANHCSLCMYSLQFCGEIKWLWSEISRETRFTALTGRLRELSDSNSQQTLVVHHAHPKPVSSFYLTWDGVVRSLHLSPPDL